MAEGYGGVRDFANQFVPKKGKFQSGWIDFPNYLKIETQETQVEGKIDEEINVGRYLPFQQTQKVALQNKQLSEQPSVEQHFPSFKEGSQHRTRTSEWMAFLNEHPQRTRFVPSTVPSILKGMNIPKLQENTAIDYAKLEEELYIPSEDLLVFATEELSLVEVEEVEHGKTTTPTRKKQNQQTQVSGTYRPAIKKRMTESEQIVQDTLLQQLPDPQAMESLAAPLKPVSGKQRRAMNRSLSWIMEQEQGNESLPYGKE